MPPKSLSKQTIVVNQGYVVTYYTIHLSESVALDNIGVATVPKASKTANARNTRNNGPVMPSFQMPNIKKVATNAITTIVAR